MTKQKEKIKTKFYSQVNTQNIKNQPLNLRFPRKGGAITLVQTTILLLMVQLCHSTVTMMRTLTPQARINIKINQYLSTYWYHQIYHNQTKYQCMTLHPFSQKPAHTQIPKPIYMDYQNAKKFIDPLIGLCVQHQTRQFVYQYCHGQEVRQFDTYQTKVYNAKKIYENIVMGRVRDTAQNVVKQQQLAKIEKQRKSQAKPDAETNGNTPYISPSPKFAKIDIRQTQQQKYIPYSYLIRSNNQLVGFDPKMINSYTIKCYGIEPQAYFLIQGIAISSHDIVLTNKIIRDYRVGNQNRQHKGKRDCHQITSVVPQRKIPIQQWEKINDSTKDKQKNNKNQNDAQQKHKKASKSSFNNQQGQQTPAKLLQKILNQYQHGNADLILNDISNALGVSIKLEDLLIEIDHLNSSLISPLKIRSMQQFLYGDLSRNCVPKSLLFQNAQPFQSPNFFILPNTTLSLKIKKRETPKNGLNRYQQILVWVEQVISKDVVRIKMAQPANQQSPDQQDLMSRIIGGIQIQECTILSSERLASDKILVMSEGWDTTVKVYNMQVSQGDTFRCIQTHSQYMFDLTIGSLIFKQQRIYKTYSWLSPMLSDYYLSPFQCFMHIKSQIESQGENANMQKENEKKIMVDNNPAIIHQFHTLIPKINQEININASQFNYQIQFQSGALFSIKVKDQSGKHTETYVVSQKKIFQIRKICNFSLVSKEKCQSIQMAYENSYFQNKTVDGIKFHSKIYIKSVWVFQKGQYVLKFGIWRKGDYEPLARMFFPLGTGTISIKEGIIFVRKMNRIKTIKPSVLKSPQTQNNQKVVQYDEKSPIETSFTLIQGQFCGNPINKHRRTEVKFKCGQPILFLQKVKQTSPCVYRMNLVSNRFCGSNKIYNRKDSQQIQRQTVCYQDGMVMVTV